MQDGTGIKLKIGKAMTIESIVGSVFKGSVIRTENFGPFEVVIPRVEGNAFITGQHEFNIDPEDSFREGFILRQNYFPAQSLKSAAFSWLTSTISLTGGSSSILTRPLS